MSWSLDSDGREDEEGEGGFEGFREHTGSTIGEGSLSGSLPDLRKEQGPTYDKGNEAKRTNVCNYFPSTIIFKKLTKVKNSFLLQNIIIKINLEFKSK